MTNIPTPKLERWKYTNLPAKLNKMTLSCTQPDFTIAGLENHAYALPENGAVIVPWAVKKLQQSPPAQDRYQDMGLWEMAQQATTHNGFIIDIPADAKTTTPIKATLTGHPNQSCTLHQIIRIGAGATAFLIDYQGGEGQYWQNIVTQIHVAKGAKFSHYRFQENSLESVVTHTSHIIVEEGASYEAFTLTCGANLSRNQIHVDLIGKDSCAHLNGINLTRETQIADTTITVEHQAPNCQSNQNYRNVVKDKSTVTFQGKVHVHQIAQKTDGYQMSKSILLSPQATINTKPELEIYADDVKCSHGATTGRLDEDALFYLLSRGIPKDIAESLLIEAFLSEVVDVIEDIAVQDQMKLVTGVWLGQDNHSVREIA